jgi:hypothetical protein
MHRQLAELVTELGDDVLAIWLDGWWGQFASPPCLCAPPPPLEHPAQPTLPAQPAQPTLPAVCRTKLALQASAQPPPTARCPGAAAPNACCTRDAALANKTGARDGRAADLPSNERWRTHETYKVRGCAACCLLQGACLLLLAQAACTRHARRWDMFSMHARPEASDLRGLVGLWDVPRCVAVLAWRMRHGAGAAGR